MISDGMSTIWIMLNLSDLHSFLLLIFTGRHLKDSSLSTSAEKFRQATIVMNLVAVVQFFKATCTGIFKHLLVAGFMGGKLLRLVSNYYKTVKTDGQRMLYLHYFVWLCRAFYLAHLRSRLQSDL